jgi:hypothetical protein
VRGREGREREIGRKEASYKRRASELKGQQNVQHSPATSSYEHMLCTTQKKLFNSSAIQTATDSHRLGARVSLSIRGASRRRTFRRWVKIGGAVVMCFSLHFAFVLPLEAVHAEVATLEPLLWDVSCVPGHYRVFGEAPVRWRLRNLCRSQRLELHAVVVEHLSFSSMSNTTL